MQQTDAELVRIAKKYGKVFIIIDPVVKIEIPLLYAEKEVHYFPIISPESKKNLDTCSLIWKELTRLNFERKDLVVNIGGGAILDIGGFAASTYKRGIDFVNVPTTLLAMADASIGGKTGINFEGIKNMIGTFQWSIATIRDYKFLETLSAEEMSNGMAEIVKHALIADRNLCHEIENNKFKISWIGWSFKIKMGIVDSDPHEKGRRKLLNFGHTIGHALEAHYKIPHGRGMGSSGAAVVSGIMAAKGLLTGIADVSDKTMLDIATEFENHPDNVAPALFGGMSIAWEDEAGPRTKKLSVHRGVSPLVLVSATKMSTALARSLQPESVPHEDAVFNVSRSALLVAAMVQSPELLFAATEDKLHQSYRAMAMPETDSLIRTLRASGHAAVVSGAGPSVLVLASDPAQRLRAKELAEKTHPQWLPLLLAVDNKGATMEIHQK
jgi:homoserine kinase